MVSDYSNTTLFFGVAVGLVILIGIYFIIKRLMSPREKEVIKIDSNKVGSTNIEKHIEKLKTKNPGVDEETLRKIYFSFRAVVLGYGKYTDSVIVCETKDPSHGNEPVNIVLSEKKSSDLNENIVTKYEQDKSANSPDWRDDLFKFPFNDENGEKVIDLNSSDKFIIDNNEVLIEDLLARSDIQFDADLSAKMIEKSIKTTDLQRTHVSPLEIMFCKYVKFFILKQ